MMCEVQAARRLETIMTMSIHPRDSAVDRLQNFHVEFESKRDVDDIMDNVGRAFKPHKMTLHDPADTLDAALHSLRIGNVTVFFLAYGAEVAIDPGVLEDFVLVQMPVNGEAGYACGGDEINGNPNLAAVLSPQKKIRMRFSAQLNQIIIRLDQRAIDQVCATHLDCRPKGNIDFKLGLDLTSPAGCAWNSTISHIVNGSRMFSPLLHNPVYAAQIERMLIDTLLFAHTHNLSHRFAMSSMRPAVAPAYVRRATEYLHAHIAETVTIEQLAQAVGVSPRALFYAFKQTYDQTPMAYLRELRLSAVHRELQSSDPATISLTDLAIRWGFMHYGHFSNYYRQRFGHRPLDTLSIAR